MTLEEAKKDMERFVSLKTSMRPAFVDVLLQAEEVRRGRWEAKRYTFGTSDTDIIGVFQCSKCKGGTLFDYYRYCPKCGAKMDKRRKNGNT